MQMQCLIKCTEEYMNKHSVRNSILLYRVCRNDQNWEFNFICCLQKSLYTWEHWSPTIMITRKNPAEGYA